MGRDHLIGKQITPEELEQMKKRFQRTTFNKKVNTDMVYPANGAFFYSVNFFVLFLNQLRDKEVEKKFHSVFVLFINAFVRR